MKTLLRVALAAVTLTLLASCAGTYAPVKDGKCNVDREWVPPAEANGKWTEGYCRDVR